MAVRNMSSRAAQWSRAALLMLAGVASACGARTDLGPPDSPDAVDSEVVVEGRGGAGVEIADQSVEPDRIPDVGETPSQDRPTPDVSAQQPHICGDEPNGQHYGECQCPEDCLDEWCQMEPGWTACSTICSPGVVCPTVPGYEVRCLSPAPHPWNEHCALLCSTDGECPSGMTCWGFEAGDICVWAEE